MVHLARILKDYRDAGTVSGLIALWGFVGEDARACETSTAGQNALTPLTQVVLEFQSDPDWLLPEIYEGIEL